MGLPKPVGNWAHKTDAAEGEWARDAVDSWARDMEFPRPFSWGEAEAAVLARDYPPLPGSLVTRLVGVVARVLIGVLAVPTLGGAVVGFAAIAAAVAQDGQAAAEGPLSLATILYLFGTISVGSMLGMWWETRRRSPVLLIGSGAGTLAAAASWAVLALSPVTAEGWLPLLIIATAVIGAVAFLLGAFSKPEGRPKNRKPPRRGPRGDERSRASRARQRLLEVIVHRRLVDLDEADRIRVAEMPLGYWNELDGLSEREWRRVLERRHVGWREFDARG
ncbi:hypothetical protein LO763_26445 [Glycomyces sp. A-F 0318]|uniref:hypothetical protein n=1 Tax=Glycomyces amatae TaxID=2881355 RepID=UPI001E4D6A63|nr:hypothetical protein [Glycomyces amatae]MCD0447162.1 hypothetical protein [Glycomyces amatae]